MTEQESNIESGEQLEKTGELEAEKESPINETPTLEQQYKNDLEIKNELEKKIDTTETATEKDHAKIDKLRQSMDLPVERNSTTASDEYVDNLKKKEQEVSENIAKNERNLLNAPEGKGENTTRTESRKEIPQRQSHEDLEKMEKEERKEYVDSFINEAIKKMIDHWRDFLGKSKNEERAKKLIKEKTTAEVLARAEDFIENGGEPDIGFEANLESRQFKNSKGEKEIYITGFNMKPLDESSPEDISGEDEEKLVNSQAERKIQEAKKEGVLEETKKGTT